VINVIKNGGSHFLNYVKRYYIDVVYAHATSIIETM